jgi:hypothetical protein
MTPETPKIDASPTKDFFVAVLVRDISLDDAIAELIDNSIDGVKKLADGEDFSAFNIIVKFDKTSFSIEDNCGGIPIEIAQHYAFRFGRDAKNPTNYSAKLPIGQFGVGMKRSLFRIGNNFSINSISQNSSFEMDVDVNKWKAKKEWEFDFKNYQPNQNNAVASCGTKINVTSLHSNVSDDFQSDSFITRLKIKIESVHSEALINGLKIKINDLELSGHKDELLTSKDIKPFFKKISIGKKPNIVEVKIYAGISTKSKENFGWYIYCNGRQVVKANKYQLTGWGSAVDEVTVPKSHTQFDRFRGYVYFESSNAFLLPWNTKKDGINENSEIYQAVRLEMILALRQVIDFLNQLDKENDTEDKPLNEMINNATSANVLELGALRNTSFKFTPPKPKVTEPMQTITYKKPKKEIERAKKLLKERGEDSNTNESVGKLTFEYFMKLEDEP